MARTEITPQTVVVAGVDPTHVAAIADGHKARNSGKLVLWVENGSGASIDVTIQTPLQQEGLDVAERVVAVPATDQKVIGPFNPRLYNRNDGTADARMIYWDYSATTSVTVAVLRLP